MIVSKKIHDICVVLIYWVKNTSHKNVTKYIIQTKMKLLIEENTDFAPKVHIFIIDA